MPKWAFALFLIALTGCREEVTLLSGAQLADLLAEDRRIAFERFHHTGTAQFHPDKTFEVSIPRLGQDTGVWWLEGDRICSRWANFRQGRELCAVVGQTQDGTYRGQSPKSGVFLGKFRFLD